MIKKNNLEIMKKFSLSRKTGPPDPGRDYKSLKTLKNVSSYIYNKIQFTNTNIMNTSLFTSRFKKGFQVATGLSLSILMIATTSGAAQARILFQDDTFHDIDSEAILIDANGTGGDDTSIQFGNDSTASENGVIKWDIANNEFDFDHDINVTGGVEANGVVNFSGATQMRIREEAFGGVFTGGGAPACAADGEIAIDTTPATENLYICTANATNTWTLVSAAAGDFLSAIASDTFGDAAGAQTLTIGDGTNADALTAAANSIIDFSASNQFIMRTEAADPGTCTEGEMYYNTITNQVRVCTATNTWGTSGPQDFEDVYAVDADNTLTASSTFDIDAVGAVGIDSDAAVTVGGAGVGITSDGGVLSLTGDGTTDIDIANAGASLDFDSATFTLDTTAGFSIDGAAASNLTTSAGDLTIAGGGELVFDDGTITGTVTLGDTDTDWNVTFSGDGILDNINSFTSTAAGEGASNVGIEDSAGNITATTVEGALAEIAAQTVKRYENILLYPEYPDTVLEPGGASSRGRMDTEVDGTEGSYYEWTTRQAADQTIDIITRIPVPEDYDVAGTTSIIVRYRTGLAATANNSVQVVAVSDHLGISCGTAAAAANITTFASHSITPAICTILPGEFIEVQTRVLADNTASATAEVGRIEFNYTK